MKILCKLRLISYLGTLVVSACGTASVQYRAPIESASTVPPGANADSLVAPVLAAAANGAQTAVLPVSRLVVIGTASAVQGAGHEGGAARGDASPPPAQPASAPHHGPTSGKGSGTTPPTQPAHLDSQPSSQAADQSGGSHAEKNADGAGSASSVTATFTSADGTVKYAVNVVQVESSVSFMVQPTNNFFSSNNMSITRLANTRIPTTVSNTFTDETAARVKTIASIAATLVPLAAAAAPSHGVGVAPTTPQCLNEDVVLDDEHLKAQSPTSSAALGNWTTRKLAWAVDSAHGGTCLDISLTADPLPPNLVPISSLATAFAGKGGDWSKVWPVPACMTVHVSIKPQGASSQDGRVASGQLTVIDPDYVELLPIPKKGKIVMHPICGGYLADSAADPYQSDFDTINAISAAFPAKKSSK